MLDSSVMRRTGSFSLGRRGRSRKRAHRWTPSVHVAGSAEGVASRLRPDRETVWLVAHGNRLQQLAGGRVDDVDDPVVAAREPQLFAVDAEVAYVGAPGVRNRPRRDDAPRGKVDHRHAALADAGLAADPREAPIRHVELRRIATRIEAVRADPRLDEADDLEPVAVDQVHTAGFQVRDVEDRAVGTDTNILRDAAVGQGQVPQHLAVAPVDLHEAADVLARHDEVPAVDGEVAVVDAAALRRRHRALQRHRLRITEVEALHRL